MVPTAPGERRIQAVSGAAAVGFADRPALVPPDAPTITSVESSVDELTTGGLDVSWTAPGGSSGYELQWRRSGEQVWQSTRTGVGLQFTVGGLVRGAFYDVQVRAVATGGDSGHVLYVTGWSASGSGIAGGWTPANVTVAPADGGLVVVWDDVPVATGYEVEYWPTDDVLDRTAVVAVRGGSRWRADILGLVNGEPYGVAVRSVRTVAAGPGPPPGAQETVTSGWVESFAAPGTFLGGRLSTYQYLGVLYERRRVIYYSVWWSGACEGDYGLWDRRASADVWSRVDGLTYSDDGAGTYRLTEPDLGIDTSSFLSYQASLRSAEGRRFQLRCGLASGSQPATTEQPPGRLLGEVVFRRSSGNSPQAPPSVGAAAHSGRVLVVSWDGFADSELGRIGSSVVGYEVQWRWFDGGVEHTASSSATISPLDRSYTVQNLTPGRAYDVRVRARSSTHDGAWSPYADRPVVIPGGPVQRDVTVTAATASEGDGSVVFTLEATLPYGVTEPVSDVAPVLVRWATVSGTAVPGSDYRGASGVVSIPADGSRATISVPLVDDGVAEGGESFGLQLTNPTGATLVGSSAEASIVDDDPAPGMSVPSVSVCDGARVSGAVGDVSDVVQSEYAPWTDVFVDVEVSCEGGLAGSGGYLVGVEILSGPAASGWNSWCVRGGVAPVTASSGVAGGCAATVVEAVLLSTRSEATHVVRVLDSAVSGAHQLRVWVDLDGDGVRGRGEPTEIVAADFASRVSDGEGGVVFGLPEDFEVASLGRGDRYWRAGQWATLRLEARIRTADLVYDPALSRPVPVWVPLRAARLGAFVFAGPSSAAEVMCLAPPVPGLVSPGYLKSCVTGVDGTLTVRYRVRAAAVTASGPQQDDLWVYWDRDGDGGYNPGTEDPARREPSDSIGVPIAKPAVSYVALGDSYSAGEAGEDPELGMYLAGKNPADGECRRWDQAYPVIIEDEFLDSDELGINVEFATFACTGAISLNVFDAGDAEGLGTSEDDLETNRPSPAAARKRLRPARPGVPSGLITPGIWEPRQAVSLAGKHDAAGVDMVTLTIGGNDAEFGSGILVCAFVSECDPAPSAARLGEIENQVVDVLDRVKAVAPDAVVFVLGYPYLTPEVDPCANPEVIRRPGRRPTFKLSFEGLPEGCEAMWDMYRAGVDECDSLSATGVVRGSLFYVGGTVAHFFVGADRTRIDYWEAKALWAAADELNAAVARAARHAGAHFVDVVGGVPLDRAPEGFVGHSSCNTAEAWMNGFVPKEGLLRDISGADGSTFHPTAAGQRAYADILEAYIRSRIDAGAPLSEAGLPRWTAPSSGASQGAGSQQLETAKQQTAGGTDSGAGERSEPEPAVPSAGLLAPRAATLMSGCGAPFLTPGEQIALAAAGFAADAAVTFATQAASLGNAELAAPEIPAATADADGILSTVWTVPVAPAAGTDAAPRAYLIDASGPNPAGGTHTALMGLALVAYPGTAPCAVADTASTTLGAAVQIAVLADDIAPTGGTLEASSVVVRDALGGSFAVDAATGAVTFTPDGGFWGTVETTYVVYDSWGIGVEADLTVTVASGCTTTGTAGVTLIEGTPGDDVICVPDRDDRRSFHIIDAKGGDDIILGGAGVEWVYGGDGADTIWGNGSDDRIVAGAGLDIVYGGLGTDSIYSIDTADTVIDDDYEMIVSPAVTIPQADPDPAEDWAWVDAAETITIDVLANDVDPNEDLDPSTLAIDVVPSAGAAAVAVTADGPTVIEYTAAGEGGSDSFSYEICDSLGNCATAEVTIMVGTADCTIIGTSGDDTLRGTPGDDVICGLGGDDTIRGIGGNDVIVGGPGDDDINGGDGEDLIWGGLGADMLHGGPGDDTVWGGAGDDGLFANAGADRLDGGPGNDTAVGGGSDDTIWGGPGDDTLDGHAGDDSLWGGPDADILRGGNGDDSLWGGSEADLLTGGAGADALHGGSGADRLDGNTQNDTLWGGPGGDTLDGQGHDDQLHGGPGADTLRGGAGDDTLWGGAGNDALDGGNGTDHLDGGAGDDTCAWGSTTSGCETPVGVR